MTRRIATPRLIAACIALAPVSLAQAPEPDAAAEDYTAPRTPFRQASLEGYWTHNFVILLEASPGMPALIVPEAAAEQIAQGVTAGIGAVFDSSLDPEVPEMMRNTDGLPIVQGQRRTRSIVTPADGKLPYTEAARKEANRGYGFSQLANNPEERPNWERCVTGLGIPPLTSVFLNGINPMHIVQTPDNIVIHTEYGSEARITPLADTHREVKPFSPVGDSIARWEGDTLIVKTIDMLESDRVRVFSNLIVPSTAKVIERFTRVSDDELLYQYTVEDPDTYTAPWLAEYSFYRTDQHLFEHACHEGNYSLENVLKAGRANDALAR